MNSRILDSTIHDLLEVIKPVQDDWRVRFQVIDDLKNVVGSLESLRGATVEPFGSFVSNLFTKSGDLDISIQLNNSSDITFIGKKYKQSLLSDLLKALRKVAGRWTKLQFVAHARVPILKLESKYQRISCDISVDNLSGQIKSKLLLWISDIDGRFRDMILLVKEWANAHNINNPKFGTFNSYSLSLLVIFHFQTCFPPILPPLRDIYPGNAVGDLQGVRVDAERQIAETCAARIARFRSDRSRTVNNYSLSEHFIQFLAKFSGLETKAMEYGICPYTAQWERISSNTRWLPKTYAIFVEDPFEQPENSARAVSTRQLARIAEAFESTYLELTSTHQNRNSQLNVLSRPGTAQRLGGRPPQPTPTFNGAPQNIISNGHHYHQNGSATRPRRANRANRGENGPRTGGNGGGGSYQSSVRPVSNSIANPQRAWSVGDPQTTRFIGSPQAAWPVVGNPQPRRPVENPKRARPVGNDIASPGPVRPVGYGVGNPLQHQSRNMGTPYYPQQVWRPRSSAESGNS